MKIGKVLLLGVILILVSIGCAIEDVTISIGAVVAESSSVDGDFVIQVDITNDSVDQPTVTCSASVEIYGLTGSESGNEIEWDVIAVTDVPDIILGDDTISYQMAGRTVTYVAKSYTVTVDYSSETVDATSTSASGDFTVN